MVLIFIYMPSAWTCHPHHQRWPWSSASHGWARPQSGRFWCSTSGCSSLSFLPEFLQLSAWNYRNTRMNSSYYWIHWWYLVEVEFYFSSFCVDHDLWIICFYISGFELPLIRSTTLFKSSLIKYWNLDILSVFDGHACQ